jgi:AhpD family alkylhydroperoxidase
MSTVDHRLDIPIRLDIEGAAPAFSRALSALDAAAARELDAAAVPARLRELVRIRASQLNGCAYCVDMHTRDALAAGEPIERVAAVSVWRESPFFSVRERAALSLAESLTRVADTHVPADAWEEAGAVYADAELGALVALITTINAWNVVSVATRAWTPTIAGAKEEGEPS